jgi:SpoVK/Ycf46/Vps4 family AAA+-type ATPase
MTRKLTGSHKFDDISLDRGTVSNAAFQAWVKGVDHSADAKTAVPGKGRILAKLALSPALVTQLQEIRPNTGPVLLAGAIGAGKTTTAQAIADDLRRPLIRLDLAGLASQYVGETSAALDRLFDDAMHSGAVLLFDEADALFGKRTAIGDAHDRYADIDRGHLLDGLQRYPGITLVVSANKGNLDPELLRRIRLVVDFPAPGGHRQS